MTWTVLATLLLGGTAALWHGPVRAADQTCVVNGFEVPWVHPGITFFTSRGEAVCEGPGITVKKDETGCFDDTEVAPDGTWNLLALDATSGACRAVCPLTRPTTRIIFSQANVYACID